MKKLIALVLITLSLCSLFTFADADSNFIKFFSVVIALNYQEDIVTCLAEDGNIWEFYGTEDWMIGDKAILVIYAPTEEIISARYIGWMDIFELSSYVVEVCD